MIHRLAIDSVELNFGERDILQGAYVGVQTGEVVGLLGRNGSGKSCLMRIIYGTLACRYRTLKIDDVYTVHAYRRQGLIRYAPQFSWLPAGLGMEQVFADFGVDIDDFLRDFPELEPVRAQRIGQLSGGERRIVEICLVLLSPVRFVLLDEPFSQVMPLHIERIKALIRREKANKGIIITDHMYRHILQLSDRVYVLANKSSILVKREEDLQRLGYVGWK